MAEGPTETAQPTIEVREEEGGLRSPIPSNGYSMDKFCAHPLWKFMEGAIREHPDVMSMGQSDVQALLIILRESHFFYEVGTPLEDLMMGRG